MKKYKNIALRLLLIIFWVGAGVGFTILFAAAMGEQKNVKVRQVKVSIDQGKELFFVNSDDVFDIITSKYPSGLVGMQMDTLNLKQLEVAVSANPFISKTELYTTIRGDVTIHVEQKEPIARVINSNHVSYYIDKNGEKMPSSSKFTPRVPVFHGNIFTSAIQDRNLSDSIMSKSLYTLARYIDGNKFWKAQVEGIFVNEKSEFELTPMLGNQTIIIGNADQLDEKFKRAMIFYKELLKNVDATIYKTVNVKYRNQIICTKNN